MKRKIKLKKSCTGRILRHRIVCALLTMAHEQKQDTQAQ